LIEETATRIKDISPAQAQTGPAIRHDDETIQKHLSLLNNHPQLKRFMRCLQKALIKINRSYLLKSLASFHYI
jgi:hypothetical protein